MALALGDVQPIRWSVQWTTSIAGLCPEGGAGQLSLLGYGTPPTDRPPTQLLMNNAEPVGSTALVNKTGTRSDRKCVATPVDSVAAVTGCFVASFMAMWARGGYIAMSGEIIDELRGAGEGAAVSCGRTTAGCETPRETSASMAEGPAEVRSRHIPNGIRYVL